MFAYMLKSATRQTSSCLHLCLSTYSSESLIFKLVSAQILLIGYVFSSSMWDLLSDVSGRFYRKQLDTEGQCRR